MLSACTSMAEQPGWESPVMAGRLASWQASALCSMPALRQAADRHQCCMHLCRIGAKTPPASASTPCLFSNSLSGGFEIGALVGVRAVDRHAGRGHHVADVGFDAMTSLGRVHRTPCKGGSCQRCRTPATKAWPAYDAHSPRCWHWIELSKAIRSFWASCVVMARCSGPWIQGVGYSPGTFNLRVLLGERVALMAHQQRKMLPIGFEQLSCYLQSIRTFTHLDRLSQDMSPLLIKCRKGTLMLCIRFI